MTKLWLLSSPHVNLTIIYLWPTLMFFIKDDFLGDFKFQEQSITNDNNPSAPPIADPFNETNPAPQVYPFVCHYDASRSSFFCFPDYFSFMAPSPPKHSTSISYSFFINIPFICYLFQGTGGATETIIITMRMRTETTIIITMQLCTETTITTTMRMRTEIIIILTIQQCTETTTTTTITIQLQTETTIHLRLPNVCSNNSKCYRSSHISNFISSYNLDLYSLNSNQEISIQANITFSIDSLGYLSEVIHPQNILRAKCCHILTIFILIDIEYQQLKVEILYISHQISGDIYNSSYLCLTFPVDQVNFFPFQIMLHCSYVLISTVFLDMIYFDIIFKNVPDFYYDGSI